MGKYEPLAEHLREVKGDSWTTGFDGLERVLGFELPRSAREYREWWANQRGGGHSQAKGWQDAGWKVEAVDLKRRQVEFRRSRIRAASNDAHDHGDEELMRQAGEYIGTTDRARIVREALQALCEREAGRRLSRLGGSMPDLRAPPRRRFE